ncbi:MAG: glycosyltransferase family 2 protein [Prochlorotrichaceae cyanobacterium]|jgi:cellulose synthase (UDP-forming)
MTIAEKLTPVANFPLASEVAKPLPEGSVYLPTPPSTQERYAYKNPSQWWAYWGLLAFACIFYSSIWFLQETRFWGYAIYIVLMTIWTLPHFLFIILGRNFNFQEHLEVVQDFLAIDTDALPSVDVFIPTCGEDIRIIENTFYYASQLQYPHLQVYALDDQGNPEVERLANLYGLTYLCRPNRGEMKKAGNLLYAYKRSQGDFILVLDADFAVSSLALQHLVPWMVADPKIAILQTPQYFETDSSLSWSSKGSAYCQEVFYRAIQPARDSLGRSAICVGTNALYRREALADIGGFYQVDASEDVHNGVALINQGWNVKYIPVLVARGLCPETAQSLFRQHYRWCTGSLRLITSNLFWKNAMPAWQKLIYFCGASYYPAAALALPVSLLQLFYMVFYFNHDVRWYVAFLFLPKILLIYLVMPLWNKANWGIHSIKSAITFSWSYLIAMWDFMTQGSEGWIATGSQQKSTRYTVFRRLLIVYCFIHFLLLIPVMQQQYEIYHFIPLLAIHGFSIYLNLDLLIKDQN